MKGTLHLIPTTLGDIDPGIVLPDSTLAAIKDVTIFIVEEQRSARRFLSKAGLKGNISGLTLYELNEHTDPTELQVMLRPLLDGYDVALISEAGLPAVADPGSDIVALAHREGIKVVPYVGPSSLMLALMASGMNGQSFAFCGYIPVKREQRRKKIKDIERISAQLKQTQIIIETPYRNDSLMTDILECCSESTMVCVASDLTLETSTVMTKSVKQWKKDKYVIGKRPTVFLILV